MKSTMIVLLVSFMAAGAFASNVFQPATGNWNVDGNWNQAYVPLDNGDEIKITTESSVCTVDQTQLLYTTTKISIASGPTGSTLDILSGGYLGNGREFRAGAAGATGAGNIGFVNQSGGTLEINGGGKLFLGYKAGGDGTYTISGGSLLGTSGGRMYIGCGGAAGSVGTLIIQGTAPTIDFDGRIYVASDSSSGDNRLGTATLQFDLSGGAVSPIVANDNIAIDAGGGGTADLIVNADVAPAADILLVQNPTTSDIAGAFDTLNGGSGSEGTFVIIGGATMQLTYQYDADGDGQDNDIALVFQGQGGHTAHTPNPADGAFVDPNLALLDWENPDPNTPGDPVYCDVYLGTEPNRLGNMDRVTLGNDISEVAVNTTNFPVYGNLLNNTTYYWAVDVHDVNMVEGPMWTFTVTDSSIPTVDAGPDQSVWLGMSGIPGQEVVYLDGTTSAEGPYTVLWTQVDNGAPAVSISPNDVDDTSVTITAADTYEFMLTVDDGSVQVSDTVQIVVGAAPPSADGFGQSATGGEDGTTVTVSTAADFESYIESPDPYIIQVNGTIDLGKSGDGDADGEVNIKSNKTVLGIMGTNPTIIGQLSFDNDASNVIIERVTITNPDGYQEGDGISLKDRITNVFITKCTFIDCVDGCLDVSNGSDYVTVSWCKFYYVNQTSHRNVNLIGSSDGNGDEDMGKLHVTFHHNWWNDLCTERMPSVRFGRAHVYNNYYSCIGNSYCVRTRLYAECLVENNYFKDVQNPWERLVTSAGGDPGLLLATGNILVNPSWNTTYYPGVELIDGDDAVFTPPYPYTLDEAKLVPGIVQWGAGAGGKDGYPPHWYHTMYGDFDISGLVEFNDLGTFISYWLATDDIDNADYYDDGRVDMREYSLFADNYLSVPPDTTPPQKPLDLWALAQNAQATLDWADSNDADFAGYNIYRSTVSGVYEPNDILNDSGLLTSSEYVDNTAANGMMYYYIVTAVDTSGNESADSVEACADPNGTPDNITLQEAATGFCNVEGQLDSVDHPGYTGYGWIDTDNATGSGINWSINITTAGTYKFTWRFANGSSSDRPAELLINNVQAVASVNFPVTGAWENWTTVSTQVTLTTGFKDIRLEALTSGGCANIDYLQIEGPGPEIAVCQ